MSRPDKSHRFLNTTAAVPITQFILNLVNIKKTVVATLVAKLGDVDKTSRRKNLTAEELVALQADAIRAVRGALTILRKLK